MPYIKTRDGTDLYVKDWGIYVICQKQPNGTAEHMRKQTGFCWEACNTSSGNSDRSTGRGALCIGRPFTDGGQCVAIAWYQRRHQYRGRIYGDTDRFESTHGNEIMTVKY